MPVLELLHYPDAAGQGWNPKWGGPDTTGLDAPSCQPPAVPTDWSGMPPWFAGPLVVPAATK